MRIFAFLISAIFALAAGALVVNTPAKVQGVSRVAVAPSATFFDPELDNPMVPNDNDAVPARKCGCAPQACTCAAPACTCSSQARSCAPQACAPAPHKRAPAMKRLCRLGMA